MADQPLLDLSTLIVRPTISIDGTRYEVKSPDELSVFDSHRFGIYGRRIEALAKSDDEADSAELDKLYGLVVAAAMVDLPASVAGSLSGAQKMAIADVFTGLLLRRTLGVAGAMATASGMLPTGATFSPGSSGSMADRRDGGFTKRLRGWFARMWR